MCVLTSCPQRSVPSEGVLSSGTTLSRPDGALARCWGPWGFSVFRPPSGVKGRCGSPARKVTRKGRLVPRLTVPPSCRRLPFGRPVTPAGSPATSCSVPSGNRRSTNERPTWPIHSIPPTARSTSRGTQPTPTGSTRTPSSSTRSASTTRSIPSRTGTPIPGQHDRAGPCPAVRPSGRREGRPLRCPRVPCQRPVISLEAGVAPEPLAVESAELRWAESNCAAALGGRTPPPCGARYQEGERHPRMEERPPSTSPSPGQRVLRHTQPLGRQGRRSEEPARLVTYRARLVLLTSPSSLRYSLSLHSPLDCPCLHGQSAFTDKCRPPPVTTTE